MTLRERVKLLCKEQSTSLNAMEIACGFAKGYASKLDKSTPNAENLRKIADFFHVSVDYLMTGKEKIDFSDDAAHLIAQIRKDTELSDALKKYFGLSDAKKKHVVELINLLSE